VASARLNRAYGLPSLAMRTYVRIRPKQRIEAWGRLPATKPQMNATVQ
jgi:hypothetical protein